MTKVFADTDIHGCVVPFWKTIIPRLFGRKWGYGGFEFRIFRGIVYVVKEPAPERDGEEG